MQQTIRNTAAELAQLDPAMEAECKRSLTVTASSCSATRARTRRSCDFSEIGTRATGSTGGSGEEEGSGDAGGALARPFLPGEEGGLGREATDIAVEFTQRGHDVQIRGKDTRGFSRWLSWGHVWRGPRFLVAVPRQYNVDLHTSGGSRLQTSGGSVVVFLAETIGVDVDAQTSGGRVTTELPVTVQGEQSTTTLQATINAGGPKLILRTSGGDIRVGKLR